MISYETNIITIEGSELLRKAKEQNKKVEIHKAAFLPFPISRDVAASLKYTNFVGSEWTQYIPELDNIEFVSGQDSNLEICTKAASEDNLFVKSIVLFAKLYNEDSDDVAFSVISDDNSVVELSETKIKVQLNASAKDFYIFGKDDESELIENIEKYTINDEGEAVSGLQFTLSKEGEDDITIGRDNVVLGVSIDGNGALVFTAGNGDQYTISGEGVEITKSNVFPEPTKETAYLSNRFGNTEVFSKDVTFNTLYVQKGTPPYDYAETIKGDGGKVYSLTGVFQKDGTPVTYTDYHFFISGEDLALEVSFELSYSTVCYIEYTEE